jgi:glutamyl/glutaminyl-tRNA synthetase
VLNYLALMGWTMPDERDQFGLDEFVEAFTLDRDLPGRAGVRRREADAGSTAR